MILHGEPGTGKSTLVKVIGQDLDMPVYIFDLSSFTNETFCQAWKQTVSVSPCIALFEDFDACYKARVNNVRSDLFQPLTFDVFINCLDGVESSDGVLTFITTNRLKQLDDSLVSEGRGRPGRINKVVEFTTLSYSNREKMANRILSGLEIDIKSVVDEGDGFTGTQFQDLCRLKALTKLNENQEIAK